MVTSVFTMALPSGRNIAGRAQPRSSLYSTAQDARRRHQPHRQLRHGITTGKVFRQKRAKKRVDKRVRAVAWGDDDADVEEIPFALGGNDSPQGGAVSPKQAWGEGSHQGGSAVPPLDFNAKRKRRREEEQRAKSAAMSSRGGLFSQATGTRGTMGEGADAVVLPTEGVFSQKVRVVAVGQFTGVAVG